MVSAGWCRPQGPLAALHTLGFTTLPAVGTAVGVGIHGIPDNCPSFLYDGAHKTCSDADNYLLNSLIIGQCSS